MIRDLRSGMPVYDNSARPIDADAELVALVKSGTPIDSIWGGATDKVDGNQEQLLRQGVVRTFLLMTVMSAVLSVLVGATGGLYWLSKPKGLRKKVHSIVQIPPRAMLDIILRGDCGYGSNPGAHNCLLCAPLLPQAVQADAPPTATDYRSTCPGLLLFLLALVSFLGVCLAALGTISSSHVYLELPRVLAIAQTAIGSAVSYLSNVQDFLLRFMGTDGVLEGSAPQLGVLGERTSLLAPPFLAGRDRVSARRAALRSDLHALLQGFKKFREDQGAFFPATNQLIVKTNVNKVDSMIRILDATLELQMEFPVTGSQVFETANGKMSTAYANMEHLTRIIAPQREDLQRMNSTLVQSHRKIVAGLQVFFGMTILVVLSAGANAVLRDEKGWLAIYVLSTILCGASWFMLGLMYPQAVVVGAMCANLNTTSGHIGEPLVNHLLTRTVPLSRSHKSSMDQLTSRLNVGCFDPNADAAKSGVLYAIGLDPETISATFKAFRLDAQFDTAAVLAASYKALQVEENTREISEINGLRDMLIPTAGNAPCSGIALSQKACLRQASQCFRFSYAGATSSFTFNCTRVDCQSQVCSECEKWCQCCDMLLQLQTVQKQAKSTAELYSALDSELVELQRNLSSEIDTSASSSFHSLLNRTQHTLQSLDESCRKQSGFAELYNELRDQLCDGLMVDHDIQWFCLGLIAFIFTPWFPLLVLGVRTKYADTEDSHDGEILPPSAARSPSSTAAGDPPTRTRHCSLSPASTDGMLIRTQIGQDDHAQKTRSFKKANRGLFDSPWSRQGMSTGVAEMKPVRQYYKPTIDINNRSSPGQDAGAMPSITERTSIAHASGPSRVEGGARELDTPPYQVHPSPLQLAGPSRTHTSNSSYPAPLIGAAQAQMDRSPQEIEMSFTPRALALSQRRHVVKITTTITPFGIDVGDI